ncbi:hypothetical protein D3C80_2006280 [compost metagenome]
MNIIAVFELCSNLMHWSNTGGATLIKSDLFKELARVWSNGLSLGFVVTQSLVLNSDGDWLAGLVVDVGRVQVVWCESLHDDV